MSKFECIARVKGSPLPDVDAMVGPGRRAVCWCLWARNLCLPAPVLNPPLKDRFCERSRELDRLCTGENARTYTLLLAGQDTPGLRLLGVLHW